MALIDYNLQKSPTTARQTEDQSTRYEWAPGLKVAEKNLTGLAGVYENYVTQQKKLATEAAKEQKTLQESAYEEEIKNIYNTEQYSPNFTDAQREVLIDAADRKFPDVDPSKRSQIRQMYGYGNRTSVSFEASETLKKQTAKDIAEENQGYMDIARAALGYEADNLSPEELVAEGKRYYNTQILNAGISQYHTSEYQLPEVAEASQFAQGISLADAVRNNAINYVRSGGEINNDFTSNQYSFVLNSLIAQGLPDEYAHAQAKQAVRSLQKSAAYLAKNRDEAVKELENKNKYNYELYKLDFTDKTGGLPYEVGSNLLANLQYVDDNDMKKVILGLVPSSWMSSRAPKYTPTNGYTIATTLVDDPTTTRGQKVNGLNMFAVAMNQTLQDGYNSIGSQEDVDFYLEANDKNLPYFFEVIDKMGEEAEYQYKLMDNNERKEFQENVDKYLGDALDNEFVRFALTTRGGMTYKDGHLYSDYSPDREKVAALNNNLDRLRKVSETMPDIVDPKAVETFIKGEIEYYALNEKRKSDIAQDLAVEWNPIKTAVGASTGNAYGRELWMNPRIRAIANRNVAKFEEATGDTSIVSEAITGGPEWELEKAVGGMVIDMLQNSEETSRPGNRVSAAIGEVLKKYAGDPLAFGKLLLNPLRTPQIKAMEELREPISKEISEGKISEDTRERIKAEESTMNDSISKALEESGNATEEVLDALSNVGSAVVRGGDKVFRNLQATAGEVLDSVGKAGEAVENAGNATIESLQDVYNKASDALEDLAALELAEPSVEYYKTLENNIKDYLNAIAETGGEINDAVLTKAEELLDTLNKVASPAKESVKSIIENIVDAVDEIDLEGRLKGRMEEIDARLSGDELQKAMYTKEGLQTFYRANRTKSVANGGSQEKIDKAVNTVISFLDNYKSLEDLPEGSVKATPNPIKNLMAEEAFRKKVENEKVFKGIDKNGKPRYEIVPTIGYGFRVATLQKMRAEKSRAGEMLREIIPNWDKFLVNGTTEEQSLSILAVMYNRSKEEAAKAVGSEVFNSLTKNQREALVDLFYNLGNERALKFESMLSAIKAGDFRRAAYEVVNSSAAINTVPKRYTRDAWKMYH